MKKIGKVGKANIEARKRIAEISEEFGLSYCEVRLQGCLGTFGLAPAHRHKRIWYKGDVDKLSDYGEWVCACAECHDKMETNKKLTDEVFKRLRK